MDLGPVRALALDLNFRAHGVPATVTRPAPDDVPISTRVIWLVPVSEGMPPGAEPFSRRDAIRMCALRRDQVATVPRGTVIAAPEKAAAAGVTEPVLMWVVDGLDRLEADKTHVIVRRARDLEHG